MLFERKAFGLRRLGSHSVLHFRWQSYGGVVTMALQPFEETLHTCCNAVTHLGRSVHLKPMPHFVAAKLLLPIINRRFLR